MMRMAEARASLELPLICAEWHVADHQGTVHAFHHALGMVVNHLVEGDGQGVVILPAMTFDAESPTRITSMPASSISLAIE